MDDIPVPQEGDAHYVCTTARLYGWHVTHHPNGNTRIARPGHIFWLRFEADGGFLHATGPGPAVCLTDLLHILENTTAPGP
ncbi:hypothetical protein [Embleya sp. NPDC059259]|uniref:hypothetical protein n=1 Tax=unclassified Embleya TaxID=2699296 RepID=UPI00369CB11E